jgi:hypothetical protein
MRPLYYLVIFDTAVISLLSVAVSRGPHPTAASIVIPTLFVANFVVIWKVYAPGSGDLLEVPSPMAGALLFSLTSSFSRFA